MSQDTTRRVRTILEADDRSKPAFDSADARLQSLARGSAMVTAALGAAGIAAAASLAVLTAKTMQNIDALAKSSDMLGVSTEALQAYQHAAELSGISNEQLGTSLRYMNQRVAEAATGVGTAATALKRMGLDAQELRRNGPEQAFEAIVARIQQVSDPMERTRLAMEIFGRSGAQMVNLTGEALADARVELEEMGLAISRVDAAKIEAANDAITRARRSFAVIGQTVAIEAAPYIDRLATLISDAAKESGGFRNQISTAFDVAITGASKLTYAVTGSMLVVQSFRWAWWELTLFIQKGIGEIVGYVEWMLDKINIRGIFDDAVAGMRAVRAEQNLIIAQVEADRDAALAAGADAYALHGNLQQSIANYRAEVKKASQEAAERLADARRQSGPLVVPDSVDQPGSAAGSGRVDDRAEREAERYRQQLMGRLDSLRQSLLSEEDAIRHSHHQRLTMIYEARSEGLISQQEFDALEIQLAQERNDALLEIENRRRDQDVANEQAIWQMKAQAAQDGASAMMNLTNALFTFAGQKNKALFNLNKIAGIAEATVSTYTGAAMALRSVPYPANLAAAASVMAAGLANVARIKSMQFGSGAAAGGFGGGTPDSPIVSQPLPQQSGPAQVQVIVQGDIIDYQRWTEDTLAPVIRDAVGRNTDFGLEVKLA